MTARDGLQWIKAHQVHANPSLYYYFFNIYFAVSALSCGYVDSSCGTRAQRVGS